MIRVKKETKKDFDELILSVQMKRQKRMTADELMQELLKEYKKTQI